MIDKIDVRKAAEERGWDWEEGKQYRINHAPCPAGTDSRQRLYVKCVEPVGSYVGHCFNCGGSGSSFAKHSSYKKLSDILAPHATLWNDGAGSETGARALLSSAYPITDIRIKAWLYKYFVFEEDWRKLELKENGGNLLLPLDHGGVQLRGFNSFFGPRYINYFTPASDKYYTGRCTDDHRVIVITEDILSAYRIYRDCHVEANACLGTSVPDKMVGCLNALDYQIIFLWLDADVAGMHASVRECVKISAKVKGTIVVVNADMSPKEYTPEELVRIAKEQAIIT